MNLKLTLDKFCESRKEHGFKRIAESGLFFDADFEEIVNTRAEFMQAYEKLKSELKSICGNAMVEDVSAQKFTDFELTKNEKLADILTLFKYRDCRFGILLWQEDKELPIELCFTAYNEKITLPNIV
jgi:hypothetical protein